MEERKLIGDVQDVIDDLYIVSSKLKNLGLENSVKKISDVIDDLALLQVRAQDYINDNV